MNIPLPGASVKLFRRRWWPSDIMPASAANRGQEMLMAERSGAGTAEDLDRVLAELRIDTGGGHLLVVRLDGGGVLAATTGQDARVGLVLYDMRNARGEVEKALAEGSDQ